MTCAKVRDQTRSDRQQCAVQDVRGEQHAVGGGRDGHPQDEDRPHHQGEQGELRQDGES